MTIGSQMNQVILTHYGIGLNPPQGDQRGPEAKPGSGADSNVSGSGAGQQPPRAALTELGRLMRNFARETFSLNAVDGLLGPRQDGGAPSLAKDDRKSLQELSQNAANAFAAISKLTVQDILNGSKPGSNVEKLFQNAADLQFELGNRLRELSAGEKYRKEGFGEFRVMLDDISFKCDSRGSEILTLFCEVCEFGDRLKASQVGDSAEFRRATVGNLVRGMAGSMHGNDKSLLFKRRIDSIEGRLAHFSVSSAVSADDVERLLAEAEGLRDELMNPSVTQTMDRDIHAALTAHLGSLREKLDVCVEQSLKSAEVGLLKELGWMNQLGRDVAAFVADHEHSFPVLNTLMRSLSQLSSEGLTDVGVLDRIEECLTTNYNFLRAEIVNYRRFPSAPAIGGSAFDNSQVGQLLGRIGYSRLRGLFGMVKRTALELNQRRLSWDADEAGRRGRLSGCDIVNAFRRNDGVSVMIESRVHGAKAGDVDPRLCDLNLVDEKKLGSGVCNTVYKLTYTMPDGSLKDYVFKPDLAGRMGLDRLVLGWHSTYANTQQSVKLNTATCDVANFLGLGRLTGRNYATVHNGQYGLLMEMAPGTAGEEVKNNALHPFGEHYSKFQSISTVGKLARELNDLRWLDIATGQGDRHDKNYLLDFGEDGRTPKVTAIDNDQSFMPYMVGVGKYHVRHDNQRFATFNKMLRGLCGVTGDDYAAVIAKIRANGYVVDISNATKAEICALRESFGFQTLSVPRQMSRRLCDRLRALRDEEIREFAERLAENVDKRSAVIATVRRLEELREIAARYHAEGKVVEDDEWGEDAVKREMECPSLLTKSNRGKKYNENYKVDYLMSSTLSRDFISVIPEKWK